MTPEKVQQLADGASRIRGTYVRSSETAPPRIVRTLNEATVRQMLKTFPGGNVLASMDTKKE